MALKGKSPEIVKPSKPKFMLSGDPGTRKTTFSLNWPSPYFIDTERGATRKQYTDKLIASGGRYFGPDEGAQDFREVINQVKELATTKHPYKSLVIDSFSKLYNLEAASAEERLGSDFGKDKREANKPARQLMRWIERIDMNVVLVCHAKEKWERRERELIMAGKTYDGPPKLAFDLDLWLETKLTGNKSFATVLKSRIEGFEVGADIPLTYETFSKLYGEDIVESVPKAITLVSEAQISEIRRLVDLLKITDEETDKWLTKAQAVEFEDLSEEQADKILSFLNSKIKGSK